MALVLRVGLMDKRDVYKTLIAAEYCCVKVEVKRTVEMHSVLETPAGPLFESSSMTRYIANVMGGLYPPSVYKSAQVEEWMAFASMEIEEGLKRWVYPRMGLGPCDPDHCLGMRIVGVQHSLGVLNTHLAKNPDYLVGNSITLADIAMTCALHLGFTRAMTKSFTSYFPHVEQYFWKLVGQPEFKKFLGEVKQAESLLEWQGQPQILDADLERIEELTERVRVNEVFVDLEMIEELTEQVRVNQMMMMEAEKIDEHKAEGENNQMMEAHKFTIGHDADPFEEPALLDAKCSI